MVDAIDGSSVGHVARVNIPAGSGYQVPFADPFPVQYLRAL